MTALGFIIEGCKLVKLTILAAEPLPTWLAHTGEGSVAVSAALRTLLVAWIRRALVTDLWSATYNALNSYVIHKLTLQIFKKKRPLPVTQVRRSDGISESAFWLLIPTRCEPRHTTTRCSLCRHGKAKA